MAFSSAAADLDDSDVVLCSMEANKCLREIFMLPRFPAALGIFETMVMLPFCCSGVGVV